MPLYTRFCGIDLLSLSEENRMASVEEIKASHAWTEDVNGHYLLLDLPDFKKEQVKIQVVDSGLLKVSGERPVNANKRVRFEQTFKIPEKTVNNAISAKFDGESEILYVTIPKQKDEKKNQEQEIPKRETEPSGLKNNDNKEIPDDNTLTKPLHGIESNTKESKSRKLKELEDKICRKLRDCESNHYLRGAYDILAKNKGIVVTAVLAFSLGMLISRSLESSDHD